MVTTALALALALGGDAVDVDDFRPLRPPVLGHVVERRGDTDVYRVIELDPLDPEGQGSARVLVSGDLASCERGLVARLLERHGAGRPNLALKTLGSKQFWADTFWFAGWRIQENVFTGHHRLLDPDDVRRAWGTAASCRTAFEVARIEHGLTSAGDHLVILLHGLGRSRDSLLAMRDGLAAAGFVPASVSYPSTRRSLDEHAAQIEGLLERVEGARRVSFVTHSLGGIVVRRLLARSGPWTERLEVGRLVMLAPPSRGSAMAEAIADFVPFTPILDELTPDAMAAVPAPSCPFGIIAATVGDGANPLVDGADDLVVGVEEARLPGADDFLVVEAAHTFLMNRPDVVAATVRFLETGAFDERP